MKADTTRFIYVAYITRKNGYRDYAYKHGFKAWRIPVRSDDVL